MVVGADPDGVASRDQRRTSGAAHRRRRVRALEQHAFPRQGIDVRCLDQVVAVARVPRRLVVDVDPEDVGFGDGCFFRRSGTGQQRPQNQNRDPVGATRAGNSHGAISVGATLGATLAVARVCSRTVAVQHGWAPRGRPLRVVTPTRIFMLATAVVRFRTTRLAARSSRHPTARRR